MVDQRPRVAADVGIDRVDVAAFALGRPPGVQPSLLQACADVDGGAHLVAEQRQRGVSERERRVKDDRGREGCEGAVT